MGQTICNGDATIPAFTVDRPPYTKKAEDIDDSFAVGYEEADSHKEFGGDAVAFSPRDALRISTGLPGVTSGEIQVPQIGHDASRERYSHCVEPPRSRSLTTWSELGLHLVGQGSQNVTTEGLNAFVQLPGRKFAFAWVEMISGLARYFEQQRAVPVMGTIKFKHQYGSKNNTKIWPAVTPLVVEQSCHIEWENLAGHEKDKKRWRESRTQKVAIHYQTANAGRNQRAGFQVAFFEVVKRRGGRPHGDGGREGELEEVAAVRPVGRVIRNLHGNLGHEAVP
ncbi:hypothetical protein B0H13DRAFT_1866191 [Mycena leptocephala]|nr:hypothetical protein B0H13DRAFT_1866191 [Mycena leptocephala]